MNDITFTNFILSYVSLSVIAGLFTFRLLNSFLDNILLPILDLTLLPETKFNKLTKAYDYKKNKIEKIIEDEKYIYIIQPGLFIKELIIWCSIMLFLFYIYKITN